MPDPRVAGAGADHDSGLLSGALPRSSQLTKRSLNMDTIASRVLKLLAKQLGRQTHELTQETSLECLGIDSLGMVEIIFHLEDEFNISIPESSDIQQRFKGIATVADIIQMVEALSETVVTEK